MLKSLESIRARYMVHSTSLDRPYFRCAFVHRNDRQLSFILRRQTAKVVHDCLPLFDLVNSTVSFSGCNAATIHFSLRRHQLGRAGARFVECLDPRFERLTILVLGNQLQLALGIFWNCYQNQSDIEGAGKAVQASVRTAHVNSVVSAVEISEFDCRDGIKGRS